MGLPLNSAPSLSRRGSHLTPDNAPLIFSSFRLINYTLGDRDRPNVGSRPDCRGRASTGIAYHHERARSLRIDASAKNETNMLRLFGHHLNMFSASVAIIEAAMIYSWSYSLYVAMMYFGYPLEAEQSMMFSAIITTFVALGMISVGMYNQQYFFKLEEAIGRAVVVMPISLAFILLLFMARDYFVFDGPERTWKYIWCVASFGVFVPEYCI